MEGRARKKRRTTKKKKDDNAGPQEEDKAEPPGHAAAELIREGHDVETRVSPRSDPRKPKRLGDSGWRRVGPTFHAFGWVYRAPLMTKLIEAYRSKQPPLNPLDVWVWEVMARNAMLGCALAPKQWLVGTDDTPGGESSVRESQGRVV